MSSAQRLRILFNEFKSVYDYFGKTKLWSLRSGRYSDNSIMRKFHRHRFKQENYVRGALQVLRHIFDRPKRKFLMFSAAAVCKSNDNEEKKCTDYITDDKLEDVIKQLEECEKLIKLSIYCPVCHNRRVISDKMADVKYCICKHPPPPPSLEETDGWVPYLEAQDVIIWRKQYKGEGQYAYKIYGKYPEVMPGDLAAAQLDVEYRKIWDNNVASLTMIEENAGGVPDQTILHWEVMWPRLFANRDYVYVRRNIETKDKLLVLMNKSCEHPCCPENKHAIRVMEYWSQMVIRPLNGLDQPGAEYVQTYYDEPGSGGMPSGVAAWATGSAAPKFLAKMRVAANKYSAWQQKREEVLAEMAEVAPCKDEDIGDGDGVSDETKMESSKRGPVIEKKWLENCPPHSAYPVPMPKKETKPISEPIPKKSDKKSDENSKKSDKENVEPEKAPTGRGSSCDPTDACSNLEGGSTWNSRPY